jgi:hypothetical protein
VAGLWFFPSILVSSTNTTDRQDISGILLKVALNTLILQYVFVDVNLKSKIAIEDPEGRSK